MATMKAAQLVALKEPLALREVPVPRPGRCEVLVRIRATGICTSDLHYREGTSKVTKIPITLGHEIAGVVEENGPGAGFFKVGDRVGVYYLVTCGRCRYCKSGRDNYCREGKMLGKNVDGGFAEFITVPERNLFRLPDNVSFAQGALISDAVGTPFHALARAAVRPGETVLVLGIGGLGSHAVQLAGIMGAARVIAADIEQAKLDFAAGLGACATVNSQTDDVAAKVLAMTEGLGADVAVDFAGLPSTLRQCLDSLGPGGRLVSVGICPDDITLNPYHDLLLKERSILGSADQLRPDFDTIAGLVESGRLDLSRSVSATIPLWQINDGLDRLEKKTGNPIRIVVVQD